MKIYNHFINSFIIKTKNLQSFFSDITVLHCKVLRVSEEKQISKYYKIAFEIKKPQPILINDKQQQQQQQIVINHHTFVYKHLIFSWLKDNMDSKVISKNLVTCWFLSYRAYALKTNLNLQNVLLYHKKAHSRLGT